MTHKGIVRGNSIELEDPLEFIDGTEVEVEVTAFPQRGIPDAILTLWDTLPRCASEDVDALLKAIESGRKAVRFGGIFDPKEGTL